VITVSDRSRSAVLALTELAQRASPGPIATVEIAERRGVPLHCLEQVFSALRRAGILRSQRGVKGGYSFRRPPAEVSVLEVVEAVDGPLRRPEGEAPGSRRAAADDLWDEARERLADLLGGVTVAELAEREARFDSALMFHI
jgi:Rrf2 family transcriptional regulator, cysteine metabolism repressor